ncbi:MAG: phage/plasmid primase, P4 family [Planctomycetota bacterium]
MISLADSNVTAERVRLVIDGHDRGLSFTPTAGKKPTRPNWQGEPRASKPQAVTWAAAGNVGARTGQASGGVVVIDADPGADLSGLDLPATVTALTGRPGGRHLYYRCNKPLGNSAGKLGPKIDVRGDGGQVVFPGSTHPDTGVVYAWAPGLALGEIDMAELPEEIYERLTEKATPTPKATPTSPTPTSPATGDRYVAAAVTGEIDALAATPEGGRNHQLNLSAFKLGTLVGSGKLTRHDAETRLLNAAQAVGLEVEESIKTIASGLDAGIAHPRPEPTGQVDATQTDALDVATTDMGNSDRFVASFGQEWRYCGGRGKWLHYDGTRWAADDDLKVLRFAKATARAIFNEAAATDDEKRQKALAKHALASQSRSLLCNMVDLARCELSVAANALDADPWTLNVENGTIDLRTAKLYPHRADDLLTKVAPVAADPAATCPIWLAFLDRIMDGNDTLIGYLQRLAGMSLTGDVSEQALFMLHGQGANGKSVYLDTLSGLLGEYAAEAAPDLLIDRRTPEHPTELADLQGRRLVVACETGEGGRLRVELVKRLTGNARLKARYMRCDYFEFPRTHKLIVATNNRPVVRESTHAIWRRLRLIPFTVTIPEAEQDRCLLDKLRAERPGILNWALAGCIDWQTDGLQTPPEVEAATAEYETEQDVLADFLEDRCVFHPGADVSREMIYTTYHDWSELANERPLTKNGLFDRLRRLPGVGEYRRNGRAARGFTGIRLSARP